MMEVKKGNALLAECEVFLADLSVSEEAALSGGSGYGKDKDKGHGKDKDKSHGKGKGYGDDDGYYGGYDDCYCYGGYYCH